MRIRKRSVATSSGRKPELHESGLHPHATSKSNPSPHFSAPYLTSHAGIIKQDHLLCAGSSNYGAGHRYLQKQLSAGAVLFKRKPCIDVLAEVESCHDEKAGMTQKQGGNASAKRIMNARHNEVKHMHGQDNVQGRVEMRRPGIRAEENKLSKLCKKAKRSVSCKGSALMEDVNAHTHPATIDGAERPRKVRPLQLILSCDHSLTAPKSPLPLCPTSSSNTSMPCTPPPLPRKSEKTWPSLLVKTPPSTSFAGASSMLKQIAEVKSGDDMRLLSSEESSRCSSEASLANGMGNRAELESSQPMSTSDFSSWQGHRRPRSHVQAGRRRPGFIGRTASSVNAKDSTHIHDPTDHVPRKKAKQNKRKPIDSLVGVQLAPHTYTSPSIAPGSAELKKQECLATKSNVAHSKVSRSDPLLLSTSAACEVPTKIIHSLLTAALPDPNPPATTATLVDTAPPVAASDHELPHDTMRCRRKDGRRWRCKAQVVMSGAPFCHYHTLKMREKHAVSVARRLSKQLENEVKVSKMRHADFLARISSNESADKRRGVGSSSSKSKAPAREICKVATVNYEEEKERPVDEQEQELQEENEVMEDAGQGKLLAGVVAGKQQMQQSVTLVKRRWRKKCKPCIRRLRDIHDRTGEEATFSLNKLASPPARACSPLPECLLNTDPCEWRSDFL